MEERFEMNRIKRSKCNSALLEFD